MLPAVRQFRQETLRPKHFADIALELPEQAMVHSTLLGEPCGQQLHIDLLDLADVVDKLTLHGHPLPDIVHVVIGDHPRDRFAGPPVGELVSGVLVSFEAVSNFCKNEFVGGSRQRQAGSLAGAGSPLSSLS